MRRAITLAVSPLAGRGPGAAATLETRWRWLWCASAAGPSLRDSATSLTAAPSSPTDIVASSSRSFSSAAAAAAAAAAGAGAHSTTAASAASRRSTPSASTQPDTMPTPKITVAYTSKDIDAAVTRMFYSRPPPDSSHDYKRHRRDDEGEGKVDARAGATKTEARDIVRTGATWRVQVRADLYPTVGRGTAQAELV